MTDDYLVTLGESGAVYENGKFVYKIKAWYNPETNEIFTEDIEQAGGGRIYLTGAIANTNSQEGGGKLIVVMKRQITLPLSLAALMQKQLTAILKLTIPVPKKLLPPFILIIFRATKMIRLQEQLIIMLMIKEWNISLLLVCITTGVMVKQAA